MMMSPQIKQHVKQGQNYEHKTPQAQIAQVMMPGGGTAYEKKLIMNLYKQQKSQI